MDAELERGRGRGALDPKGHGTARGLLTYPLNLNSKKKEGPGAAQRKLGARAKGGGGSGEASAQRWSRAFRVRAALVSSGGVPPSLPGTPAGWLPGAKRAGSSIGRGATSAYQNGALTVQNITGLGLAVLLK